MKNHNELGIKVGGIQDRSGDMQALELMVQISTEHERRALLLS